MHNVDPGVAVRTVEDCLSEIEIGVTGMREALLSRNQEAIMASVSSQERLLEEFASVWNVSQRTQPGQGDSIRKTIGRIRGLLRQNAVIARTFLDLISGTIDSLNAKVGHRSCAYDETGRTSRYASPLLVHDQG